MNMSSSALEAARPGITEFLGRRTDLHESADVLQDKMSRKL